MTSPTMRRPLPAVIALLALLLLTGIVWWRVLNRNNGTTAAPTCPTPTATAGATLPGPGLVTVQVLNSTSRSGIAEKARSTLVNDGFNSPNAAANDKPNVHIPGVAQIRYGPKGKAGARLLKFYFPKATLIATKSKSATVVVSLGARYQGITTPSAVTAALNRQRIELRTSSPSQPTPSPTC